jgi:hypothetical protein
MGYAVSVPWATKVPAARRDARAIAQALLQPLVASAAAAASKAPQQQQQQQQEPAIAVV